MENFIAFAKELPVYLLVFIHFFIASLPTIILLCGLAYAIFQLINQRRANEIREEEHRAFMKNIDDGVFYYQKKKCKCEDQ